MNKLHFFLHEKKDVEKKSMMIKLIRNIYVVDNFKTNLLIKMNIFNSKEILIDFLKKT